LSIAKGTQAQLQQVMSHKDAAIFLAYLNERVQFDCQAAFLGKPSNEALLKSVSHMSRSFDRRAPTSLADSDINELKTDSHMISLRERRDALSAELRQLYGSIKGSVDSVAYGLYQEAKNAFAAAKKKLRRLKLTEVRSHFFDNIETEDARMQLLGLDLDKESWDSSEPDHVLPERKQVADILCDSLSNYAEEDKLARRISGVEAVLALCRRTEPKQKRTIQRDWGVSPETRNRSYLSPLPTIMERDSLGAKPVQIPNTGCIFCFCKLGHERDFCRPFKAREHLESQHLSKFAFDSLIPCPDRQYCSGVVLYGHDHFKNHLEKTHGCVLAKKRQQYGM
jgi:hypothetical protein